MNPRPLPPFQPHSDTNDTALLRQRIALLEEQLESRNETIMDLEMTVATVQAELDYSTSNNNQQAIAAQSAAPTPAIAAAEATATTNQQATMIRQLQDELQRAQHEVKMVTQAAQNAAAKNAASAAAAAAAANAQASAQQRLATSNESQQQNRPSSRGSAGLLPWPTDVPSHTNRSHNNDSNNMDGMETSQVVPVAATAVRGSSDSQHHFHQRSSHNSSHTHLSTTNQGGSALARHLLLSFQLDQHGSAFPNKAAVAANNPAGSSSNCSSNSTIRWHSLLSTIAATADDNATTSIPSEEEILWWLLLEMLSLSSPSNVPSMDDDYDALLSSFLATLTVSPSACQFMIRHLCGSEDDKSTVAADTSTTANARSRNHNNGSTNQTSTALSSSRIRVRSKTGETLSNATTTNATTGILNAVELNLTSPLWTPTSRVAQNGLQQAHEPAATSSTTMMAHDAPAAAAGHRRCRLVRRFWHDVCQAHIVHATSLVRATRCLQIITLLLSHCHERDIHVEDNEDDDTQIQTSATHSSTFKNSSSRILSDEFMYRLVRALTQAAKRALKRAIDEYQPLRLLQIESVVLKKKQGVARLANWDQARFLEALSSSLSSPEMLWTWMTEALHCIIAVWNHASSTPLRRQWMDGHWTALILAAVVDIVEYVVVPNIVENLPAISTRQVTIRSLGMECIAWLETLVRQSVDWRRPPNIPMADTAALFAQRQFDHGLQLVRTRQTTSESTAELWHFAPSAIAMTIQLFYRIAVAQAADDHLPTSPIALAAIHWTPLRNQLIQWFHTLLLIVWDERRRSAQQEQKAEKEKTDDDTMQTQPQPPQQSSSSSSNNTATNLTLSALFSERLELYTNAAASILTIPIDSVNKCQADPDTKAMLQAQMDEILEDKLEQIESE